MLPPIYSWLNTSAVQTLVDRRVYRHGNAPQDTTRPYVTWSLVFGLPDNELSAPPVSDRYTIQIDCWHPEDSGVEELAVAVRDAIEAYAHITGMPVNERDAETKLYRIALQADVLLNRE
jgi:hypothetical protein